MKYNKRMTKNSKKLNDKLSLKSENYNKTNFITLLYDGTKHLPPWILALPPLIYEFTDKFISAKDAHLYSNYLYFNALLFIILILPYFITNFNNAHPSLRNKLGICISSEGKVGKKVVLIIPLILIILWIGGLLAATFGYRTKAPKLLIPQIEWLYRETKTNGDGGEVNIKIYSQYKGRNDVLKITFDTRKSNSYVDWNVHPFNNSLSKHWIKRPFITFQIRPEKAVISHLSFYLKDNKGNILSKELSQFLKNKSLSDTMQWQNIEININNLISMINFQFNWQEIRSIGFSSKHNNTDFTNNYVSFLLSEMIFWDENIK